MNLRALFLILSMFVAGNAVAQLVGGEPNPFECSSGQRAARADISANRIKYYQFGFRTGGPIANMFEYMAYKHFNIAVLPPSCMVMDEDVCYNQVIDSYVQVLYRTELHKAVRPKIDSFDKSVPERMLPKLYNDLGLIYIDAQDQWHEPTEAARKNWMDVYLERSR